MTTQQQKMIYYDHKWPAKFDTCPPDRDFGMWLADEGIVGQTIFHMGTGEHHRLGQVAAWLKNYTIGITASRGEMDAYEELAINKPEINQWYHVIFGDIYLINPYLLPQLDILALFHLCEFTDPRRTQYGGCSDEEVVNRLMLNLRPGGRVITYPRSMAYNNAGPIFVKMQDEGRLQLVREYESLRVYRKVG